MKMLIDDRREETSYGAQADIHNPGTDEVPGRVPRSKLADVTREVAAIRSGRGCRVVSCSQDPDLSSSGLQQG